MYLSRIKLDTKKRETMIALSNPQKIHGAIESALGIEHERLRSLWRIDELRGETYLLVLTKRTSNVAALHEYQCSKTRSISDTIIITNAI